MVLQRVLGTTDAAWLVAGNMIGAGIFITPGLVAGGLPGSGWVLAAWMAGGGISLCGAAVYGELGTRLPRAGGDYQYVHAAFGPLWGFLTGWAAMTVTFSGAAAVMAIVAVDHAAAAWPALAGAPAVVHTALAPACILALTAANVAGARVAGRTTAWLTVLPVLGLAVLFGAGLLWGRSSLDAPAAGALPQPSERSWIAFGAAMIPVFFTYSGWNAAAYVAGEIRTPGRDLPRGLWLGTLAVAVFYVGFNGLLLAILPPATLAGSTTAASQAARLLWGPRAESVLGTLVVLAVLGSANVTLMAGARIYYAMAADALAPRPLGATNTAGVPSAALWVGGIWTALLSTIGRIEALVQWATLAILLLSSLAVAAIFVLRRARVGEETSYRCPGYPWTPALYLLAVVGIAVASSIHDWRGNVYGLLVVVAGVPVYALWRRRLRYTRGR